MSVLLLYLPVALPVLGVIGYCALPWNRGTAWIGAACAAGLLAVAVVIAVEVDRHGPRAAGMVRADGLTAFMLVLIGAVSLLATAATPAYMQAEIDSGHATGRTARRHSVLVQAFLAAMAFAVLAADLGLLWIAVEATTILTAFLVGQRRTRAAVEAAWKYVVICSTGIALAFLGTVLLNFVSQHSGGPGGLAWVDLVAGAHGFDSGVTRTAVALLIIGFGTKAGLAPMHAWLPDAHSQAPAPVSALMSGVLLPVALYAILRVKVVADAALGTGFARTLLIVLALSTLLVAATLLLAQRDYKRMLAYSSIEHMGVVALGAAVGTRLAIIAVLLHILGHGLVKAVLFLSSGRLLQVTGTSLIPQVRGLVARQPALAGCFGAGILALIGFPPFSVFSSELGIVRAGFADGLGWVMTIALMLVLVIAAALFAHTGQMLLGDSVETLRLPAVTGVVLVAGLAACAAIGIAAWPLRELLDLAAGAVVR